jgi:DNA transformation protein
MSRPTPKPRPTKAAPTPRERTLTDPQLAAWLAELEPLGEVRARRMFGAHGLCAGSTLFGIAWNQRLFFKTDEASRSGYVERGSGPFHPAPDVTLKAYYEVPTAVLDDTRRLVEWARTALAVAETDKEASSKGPGECPPEVILGPTSPRVRELAERARALVRRVVPDADEAGRPGWKIIGYSRKRYFCFIAPQADHVRLGFEWGVKLADPHALLEGTGSQVRWVTLGARWPKQAALEALIRDAAAMAGSRAKPKEAARAAKSARAPNPSTKSRRGASARVNSERRPVAAPRRPKGGRPGRP